MQFTIVSLAMFGLLFPAGGRAGRREPPPSGLPPSEATARTALETSPRHGEFVDIALPSGGTALRSFVVYPERPDKAGVVIVIHEIYGLSDWIRGVADRLAADGFIAIAPDLVSGMGPGGGGTDSIPSRDDVVKLVSGLAPELVRERLDAVRAYAAHLPASDGKVATLGFCWGGGQSFAYAASEPAIAAAVVYYGVTPDSATLRQVRAPVLGHYGGDDARVNATLPQAREALKRGFDARLYPGAGHGFLRQQGGRDGANLRATSESWPRTVSFLRSRLR